MNEKKKGYPQKHYAGPVKRYCQTLDLKDDPDLIQEYVKRHGKACQWPEIREGIRSVGILEMEIYLLGTRLFMIVETPLDFEWDEAFARLAELPRQSEWEEYMSVFQQSDPKATSSEKWKLMDRIFYLYENSD
jgi:L-rhamnose mutarotase